MELFYVVFLTASLYIQWDQFIIVYVTLPAPCNYMPSSFILDFKRLHLNLLHIVTLLTLKVVLGDHPTRLATILTIFKYIFVKVNPNRDMHIFVPTICQLSKQNIYHIINQSFGRVYINRLKRMARNGCMGNLPKKSPWLGITLSYFSLDQGN